MDRLRLLCFRLKGIKWDGPDPFLSESVPVDSPDDTMRQLISTAGLARRLDIDRRTLTRVIDATGIAPDFVQSGRKLFYPERLKSLCKQVGEARR